MHLGLDVGTGMTKLVRHVAHSPHEPTGQTMTAVRPTAMVYRGLVSGIPEASYGDPYRAGTVRCDGFPIMLDTWSSSRIPTWGGRTPAEVMQGFLRCLLKEAEEAVGAEPDDLVVAADGSQWRQILAALGQPSLRVVAAPVATVVHLRHAHPELSAVSRFVICDVGAGSLSLALCTIGPRGPELADRVRLGGAAAWSEDTMPSVDNGHRPPTLAECLATAVARVCGATSTPIPDAMSVRRWRALEDAFASDAGWQAELRQEAPASRNGRGGARSTRIADLEVTPAQLLEACTPLAAQARSALTGLLARQADPGWRRWGGASGTRLVLLGGLSALGPVRAALMTAAGLDPDEPVDAIVELDQVDRLCAAASGADLLAAGKADLTDRYPHALRLAVHRVVRDRLESREIELAAAGSLRYEQAERPAVSEAGEPLLLTVKAASGRDALPIQIVHSDSGVTAPAAFRPEAPPPPGVYHLGLAATPEGVTVVLHNVAGGHPLRYVLLERGPEGSAPWTQPSQEVS